MKIQFHSKKNQGFIVLLVCLGAAAIIAVGMTSYLGLVQGENATVARSQVWNNSMATAEAGIEEGMALVNKYVSTGTTLSSWPSTAVSADGWTQSGSAYTLTRNFGTGHYTVIVTNVNATTVTIKSTGTLPGPNIWSQQSGMTLSRAVLVTASGTSSFVGAILAKKGITLSGSAIVDSFDSSNPLYSTNGQYIFSKHKAGGNMMTDASNVVMTTMFWMSGGSHVYGHVTFGPGDTISYSGSATIGDTNYNPGSSGGIEAGWTNSTANVVIPDAPPIFNGANVSPFSMPTMTNNTYVLNGWGPGNTNYYYIPSGFGNLNNTVLVTNGTVFLNIQGDTFHQQGSSQIIVAPNANLVIWLSGKQPQLTGSGMINQSGDATKVTIYGTTNCTSITYSGGTSFIGTIYAPQADMTYSGSAAVTGSVVANSFNDSGGASIHFDEALQGQASGSYIVSSWSEVRP